MKFSNVASCAAAALVSLVGAANAGVVYNNPYDFASTVGGDCSFGTVCATTVGRGNEYAAQQFTLASTQVLTMASFTELDSSIYPVAAKWGFLLADGAGGLPGTVLATGTNAITASPSLGSSFGLNVSQNFFNLGTVTLGPGTYYFAIQAQTTTFGDYLGQGVSHTGAAESQDGGVTWAFGYENGAGGSQLGGVAVELFSASVPEPATWALMLIGVGGLGVALRRRPAKAALTA